MATSFKYVQGDTGPQIRVTLTEEDTGNAVDLTGATVTLHFRAAGEDTVLFSRGFYVNPDTAENGIAILQWETTDLNQDAGGRKIYLCKKRVNSDFIKNIKVAKNDSCPEGYTIAGINLNKDAGGDELYICTTNTSNASTIIDTAFVWGGDNNLYFFKDSYYWRFDDKKQMMETGFPKKIQEFWGKLPTSLDAVVTYPYNQKTYFFKGAVYYEYDEKKMKIKNGYPKYIKTNWRGVPDNIDGIYVDVVKRQTYFIKGKYYYLYDDKNRRVAAGYPRIITRKWEGAPVNISAMFYYPFAEKTYMIQSNSVYEVTKENTMSVDSPSTMTETFGGIV